MEKSQELPEIKKEIFSAVSGEIAEQKTPSPATKQSFSGKSATPDRLNVPKAFKYPERYTSPTDQMMSPVSKRLLCNGRTRKASGAAASGGSGVPLPPAGNAPKAVKIQGRVLASPLQSALLQS